METFTGTTSDYLWPLVRANLHTLKHNKESIELAQVEKKTAVSNEPVGHTGQKYDVDDYRRIRFEIAEKKVNPNFAIDLVQQDPIVVCDKKVVCSSSGGPLGHPKIYINIANGEVADCGYSGRRFILKKAYDPAKHGKSISYDEYLKEMELKEFGSVSN